MRVFVYNYNQYDEAQYFERYAKEMGLEISHTDESLNPDNCILAEGCEFVSVTTNAVTAPMIDTFKRIGVKLICTRSIGYDHIDVNHAKDVGMMVTHITYDPEGVAEFTVMGILMAVHRMKEIMSKTAEGDFRSKGFLAGELKTMTVGIIGAGRIGTSVIRDLSGFGCRLLYHNRSRKDEADRYAEYVDLDTLLKESDVVSLHLELNADTRHIIDSEAISRMKDGAIMVNTARGALIDTEALIHALETGHLSSAALDVVEDEFDYYYLDCRDRDLSGHYIGRLRAMPNVVFTHHMAYFYRNAIEGRVYNALLGMKAYMDGEDIPLRLV